jgi:hypothetical protein
VLLKWAILFWSVFLLSQIISFFVCAWLLGMFSALIMNLETFFSHMRQHCETTAEFLQILTVYKLIVSIFQLFCIHR